jgi:hypothetical protein
MNGHDAHRHVSKLRTHRRLFFQSRKGFWLGDVKAMTLHTLTRWLRRLFCFEDLVEELDGVDDPHDPQVLTRIYGGQ